MIPDNDILQELRALGSPLAELTRANPYAVPPDYFTSLSALLSAGINAEQCADPTVSVSKALPFSVPEGYFNELPGLLLQVATKDASGKGAIMPHEVPQGYFDNLPATLLTGITTSTEIRQPRKTVTFLPAARKKLVQWAAAAMLLLGLSIGSYHLFNNGPADLAVDQQLAQIEVDTLDHYIDQQVDDFDTDVLETSFAAAGTDLESAISTLNEQEISEYLDDELPQPEDDYLN